MIPAGTAWKMHSYLPARANGNGDPPMTILAHWIDEALERYAKRYFNSRPATILIPVGRQIEPVTDNRYAGIEIRQESMVATGTLLLGPIVVTENHDGEGDNAETGSE